MILVTPYLANPGAAPPLANDGIVAAGDGEANFLGHMQKLCGVGDLGARRGLSRLGRVRPRVAQQSPAGSHWVRLRAKAAG